jgi:hypothetical protein
MGEKVLDDFEDLSNWAAITSGQAQLRISHDQGVRGHAMRLDYDFKGAGGFVVARREMPLVVPESYSFGFDLRGSAPANSFEFKLIDASDTNVWRYRVEAFEVPKQWHPLRIRNSQIDFAWGPLGGGPPSNVAAIELVFAAGPGGAGTVWVDNLWFRDDTYRLTPTVSASSRLPGCAPQNVLAPTGQASWRSAAADEPQWLLIDFQQQREYGGLVVEWAGGLVARHFDVQISNDADRWRLAHTTRQGDGARSYVYLPQTRSRFLRLYFYPGGDRRGVAIRRITVKPFEFSRTINHFFEGIAREEAIGHYPKYLIGRQTYWTVVGTGTADTQALMNEEGMVEVDKGSFSIEPFIYANGRLVTWADVDLDQKLAQRYLPLPSVRWRGNHFALEVTAFATDGRGGPVLFLRYRVTNTAGGRRSLHLFTVLRPFQVTPTWQSWHSFGGVSTIDALSYAGGTVWVNGDKPVVALTPPAGFGAAAFAAGTITEYLAKGRVPPATDTRDGFGRASGALRFDLDLGVGAADEVCLAIPLGGVGDGAGRPATPLLHAVSTTEQFEQALGDWKVRLGAIDLQLGARVDDVATGTANTPAAAACVRPHNPQAAHDFHVHVQCLWGVVGLKTSHGDVNPGIAAVTRVEDDAAL